MQTKVFLSPLCFIAMTTAFSSSFTFNLMNKKIVFSSFFFTVFFSCQPVETAPPIIQLKKIKYFLQFSKPTVCFVPDTGLIIITLNSPLLDTFCSPVGRASDYPRPKFRVSCGGKIFENKEKAC